MVVDSAYAGRFRMALARLRMAVQVRGPDFATGFVLLPKRWRIEPFSVGRFCRRLLVDHETVPHVAESMMRFGSIMPLVHASTA